MSAHRGKILIRFDLLRSEEKACFAKFPTSLFHIDETPVLQVLLFPRFASAAFKVSSFIPVTGQKGVSRTNGLRKFSSLHCPLLGGPLCCSVMELSPSNKGYQCFRQPVPVQATTVATSEVVKYPLYTHRWRSNFHRRQSLAYDKVDGSRF